MTTRSPASHELPSTAPLTSSQGRASQSLPKREGSAWAARLQRARDAVLGAVRGAWTSAHSIDASSAPVPVLAAATGSAPPEPRVHREEDRTTRIFQRPALESAEASRFGREDWPSDEVSTTSRLPSAHLDALLLQLQYDAGFHVAATPAPEDPRPAVVEVSSITYEELDEFRRSLGDHLPESDQQVVTPTTPPAASLAARALSRMHSATRHTLRWGGALAARCVLRLRYLALALMATIVKLRTRRGRPVLPVPVAAASPEATTHDASASK